jgi:hypothetical protein
MQNMVGIFPSVATAEEAIKDLLDSGMSEQSIIFLSGEAPGNSTADAQVDRLPTTDAEGDGMGKALGALIGGALGASAGLAGGAAVASLAVPGVGTIFAIGLGAAAALGLGGAAAGAKAGEVTEHALDAGVPRDDVPFYHELLRRGRSLVIATVESEEQASTTRSVLKKQGSEDVDAARKELKKAA